MPNNPAHPFHRDERRFQRLVESLDHAVIWEFDDSLDTYTFVSEHSLIVLGCPWEDWLEDPKFLQRRTHPQDLPALEEMLAKLRSGDEHATDLRLEHRCLKPDGNMVWVHTGIHVELEHGHRLLRGVTIDVNNIRASAERERGARTQAEQALAVRDEVLAVVTHDLRNPLNTIQFACSLLEEQPDSAARQITLIRRAVRRLDGLIGDLVDATNIRTQGFTIARNSVLARELLRGIADEFDGAFADKGVSLTLDIDAVQDTELSCDPRRIAQALANLLNNALKFTDAGGEVTLSARQDAYETTFVVSDDGQGIAEPDLARVFERAWQSEPTAHLGSGMGLYIVKGIVEAHAGRIWVESQVGRGSSFFFTLPCVAP